MYWVCSVVALIIWDLSWKLPNCSGHKSYFVFHVNKVQKAAWTEIVFSQECSQKKVNLLYLLYSRAWGYCLLHLKKQNCLLKIFLRTQILKINLKLRNISIIPKMVKKVITNLDLSKLSRCDCIPVVVVKNLSLNFHTY